MPRYPRLAGSSRPSGLTVGKKNGIAVALRGSGTMKSIAKRHGVSSPTVTRLNESLGVRRPMRIQNAERRRGIEAALRDESQTMEKIAKEFNLSKKRIQAINAEAGIRSTARNYSVVYPKSHPRPLYARGIPRTKFLGHLNEWKKLTEERVQRHERENNKEARKDQGHIDSLQNIVMRKWQIIASATPAQKRILLEAEKKIESPLTADRITKLPRRVLKRI